MRVERLSFAAGVALSIGFGGSAHAATEPAPGAYVVSGSVSAVVAGGNATCPTTGTKISGYSYWPGDQNSGRNFTIIIPPVSPLSGVALSFPPLSNFTGQVWTDTLTYSLPPKTRQVEEPFTLAFTAFNANSFSITLKTTIGTQVFGTGGTCSISYALKFQLGLPSSLF